MNQYESFRQSILKKSAVTVSNDRPIHVRVSALAAEYGIPDSHACEQLTQLASEGLISLVAWDGRRERPSREWPDLDSFFFNRSDNGYVRIRLRSPGAELLSELPRAPIGFGLT